jgi:aldehyde dehydrogenase (NAD+)
MAGLDFAPTSNLLIGGSWLDSASGGVMEHINPATGKVQAKFPLAGQHEIDEAVKAAKEAFGNYRKSTPSERRNLLLRIAAELRRHAHEFSILTTLECGMTVRFAQHVAERAASWFEYYAGWTDKLAGEVLPSSGLTYTRLEPYGVVAIILTWNGAVGSIGMKAAAALAAGCTVVIKPPELAPFTAALFAQLCMKAGTPPGVVNLVTGDGSAGSALVRHSDVSKISFTGGVETGRQVQAAAAETLTPVVLELGGKSVNLVFDDADLDHAMAFSVVGMTRMAGQVCHAPTRMLIHESLYETLSARLAKLVENVHIGDPHDPLTDMGPVISHSACDRILGLIESAKSSNEGRLIAGGCRVGGSLAEGFYIPPTVFMDVDQSSTLVQEEVFGPVLAISSFRNEDEAIEMANDTPYGLAAYIQSTNLARVHRLAGLLEAGNVGVNGGGANNGPIAPFGGYKNSGFGREGGHIGILEYLYSKTVNINL